MLLNLDSPGDLVLRGYDRKQVLARTGVDVGYHGATLRTPLKGIDRDAYKVEHVQVRRSHDVDRALTLCEQGADKDDVLAAMGLAGSNVVTLRVLFEALGRGEDFITVDRRRRRRMMQAGFVQRHGVDNPFKLEQFQEQAATTREKRYGGRYTLSSDSCLSAGARAKVNATFGDEVRGEQVKAKRRSTMIERYGADHPMRVEAIKDKAKQTSSTTRCVDDERHVLDVLHQMLVDHFGVDDVKRQYGDDERYPFACDFYIRSRDLFIELNAMWTHGGHWFDAGDPKDQAVVEKWRAKSTTFYDAAINQWCVRDVAKRERARQSGLDYITFWDVDLADAALWLALGAPSARDYEREFSWLPDRQVSTTFTWPRLDDGERLAVAAARAATGSVFYARERAMWNQDATCAKGRVRGRLLANRYRHLGKLPHELSDLEILRGLSIAGMIRSWTVFGNAGMKQVLDTYRPREVYDPCAGWGERLVTCAVRGIAYTGVDIAPVVVAGHERLVEHYGLTEQRTICTDAATHDASHGTHDMVFTCPPYGSTEMYDEVGAQNLDHESFLDWWSQVVKSSVSSSTRVFAYQINQRFKDEMNQVLIDHGWTLTEQIPVGRGRASHFRRLGGVMSKTEYEEVQVFTRG